MPAEEKDERTPAQPSAGGAEPPSYEKEEGTRLGTKLDSREADGPKDESPPEPRDNLRDGT